MRLYECYNRRSKVRFIWYKNIQAVYECDLLEKNIRNIPPVENKIALNLKLNHMR